MRTHVIRSSIFMMSVKDWTTNRCDICGVVAVLKYRDSATKDVMGTCCLGDAIAADRVLSSIPDLRRPETGDSVFIANH